MLADLVNVLSGVSDWIPLGLNLGVEISTLEAIEMERITIGARRVQMLFEWQKQATPTWSAVIQALFKMGMRHLATHLAQRNGTVMLMEVNLAVIYHISFFRNPCAQANQGRGFGATTHNSRQVHGTKTAGYSSHKMHSRPV